MKEKFKAVRRAYRVAHKLPILGEGIINIRLAATSALRAVTGKWDTCEPAGRSFSIFERSVRRTSKGKTCGSPVVWRACTEFLKTH